MESGRPLDTSSGSRLAVRDLSHPDHLGLQPQGPGKKTRPQDVTNIPPETASNPPKMMGWRRGPGTIFFQLCFFGPILKGSIRSMARISVATVCLSISLHCRHYVSLRFFAMSIFIFIFILQHGDIDMKHGHSAWRCSMGMQHIQYILLELATWDKKHRTSSMDLKVYHAAWASEWTWWTHWWTSSIDMQHGWTFSKDGHLARTCSIHIQQHVHAA